MATDTKIRIGILTSSRADFGVYLPLLEMLKADKAFELEIIAFGTHLSPHHGFTLTDIEKSGFVVRHKIYSLLLYDNAISIASSYALTALKFSDFWENHRSHFDWVFCLGDRFEMAAAVAAGIPLRIRFAHIHGGEITLGAIDNIYRNCITLTSYLHFVALPAFRERVKELTGSDKRCYVTGSLSLDNLANLKLLSKIEFKKKWGIELNVPSVLITFHPETIDFEKNEAFAVQALKALREIAKDKILIVTMANADTSGMVWRQAFSSLKKELPDRVHLIENFGSTSYFTCLKHVDYLIGNTSSGIIEAASFRKYVINVGDRQKGRVSGSNVFHVPFRSKAILDCVHKLDTLPVWIRKNMYEQKGTAKKIMDVLTKMSK